MKKEFLIVLFCFPLTLFSQHWKYDEFIPKYKNEILDSTNIKTSRESRILSDLCFTGAYQELYDRLVWSDTTLESVFLNLMEKSKIQDAREYIISKSKTKRILITNEAHHRPEHRVFTTSLLEELYSQGYRYLALEAILSTKYYNSTEPLNTYNLGDTTIMSRGYPLMKACSGTYAKEPQYGNMIRKAIELGYNLVGYEERGKTRELNQAKNIARIFDIDPNAKIIVHCGYGHLIEMPRTRKNGKIDSLMAYHLKQITGHDPFTIDQTHYAWCTNVSEIVFEDSKASSPQIIMSGDEAFKSNRNEEQDYWDLTIFHKPITFLNNRPLWLVNNSSYIFEFDQSLIKLDFPVRIKLLNVQDRLDAVPVDIIEVDNQSDFKLQFYGNKAVGKLIVENQRGDRQLINVVGKPTSNKR